MKCFEINSVAGLYNEFYVPVNFEKLKDDNNEMFFSNLNNHFWKKIFSSDFINLILETLEQNNTKMDLSIWEKAVLVNKNRFEKLLKNGLNNIINYKCSQKEMFSILESFSIYCTLISKYYFNPVIFTLQEGIISADNSMKKIVEQVKTESHCKEFLINFMKPNIEKIDFLWVNGTVNYTNLIAISMFKKLNNNLFVAIRFHESEYFSYNKITDYLENNQLFFEYIDCIILDNSDETIELVEKNFKNRKYLNSIPNIIYYNNGMIIKTRTENKVYDLKNFLKVPLIKNVSERINESKVINMRLFANNSCYWHQCAFCGINRKYKYQCDNIKEDLDTAVDNIRKYCNIGYQYFWFEDEAIRKVDAINFANLILEKNMTIYWQVRSRFDDEYTLDECKLLYRGGLREIRFGYESGSRRVLEKMNKYPENFDYTIIEKNIRNFSLSSINVHLPVILGFPVEQEEDMNKTIESLQRLKEEYSITFNLNRFLLDVSSDAFQNFSKYNIHELQLPTECDDFIGNFAYYNFSMGAKELDIKRAQIMKEVLYSWMPDTALTIPIIFYRLTESSRMTLIWATEKLNGKQNSDSKLSLNENISIIETSSPDDLLIYIWDNHHIMKCKYQIFEKLQFGQLDLLEPDIVNQAIEVQLLI